MKVISGKLKVHELTIVQKVTIIKMVKIPINKWNMFRKQIQKMLSGKINIDNKNHLPHTNCNLAH
jgi:hypothetical protein